MAITLKERPIIMMGAERSGTTLVMAMLGCHPRIAVPEVVWYYSRFRPYIHTYGDLNVDANFRTLVEEMVFGLKTPFWGMKVNARTIVDEVIEMLRERSFAGIYCAMHEYFARQAGDKPRWGEKTPYNVFFIKEILEDFPKAQLIYITRDGRDTSVDYLESAFGPTNIFCAADIWKLCWNAASPWREKLPSDQWLDVKYETLVRDPEKTLQGICDFLGEAYDPAMMAFHEADLAKARGATHDHKPLGHPVSDEYIGIYKELLSRRDQRVFAAVAGEQLIEAGYQPDDLPPLSVSAEEEALYREKDGRLRAATLDAPEGHIVYESYNDWLIDQREERRRKGLWSPDTAPSPFPIGDPDEELFMGQRAWRSWKEYFCVKRRYHGKTEL